MRYVALAADYDGTLASQGRVRPATVDALRRLSASGRKLILVTGRELGELSGIFPDIGVFDRVVAENGALLYCPSTKAEKTLGDAPPPEFAIELRRRGVDPLSVGRSIVATVTPNENAVLDTIRDFGLELQVIFNKGAVMVLPAGVNKASGLAVALQDLGLSARNVAAVGDAENDHALLRFAEFGAAVANALPMLKRDADWVSPRSHGEAVIELIDAILADDLRTLTPAAPRRKLTLGPGRDGRPIAIPSVGCDVFITGASGSGKSVFAAALLERLAAEGYQYCVFDPQGDYAKLPGAVMLGSRERAPTPEELATALAETPTTPLVVCLSALSGAQRPQRFKEMLAKVHEARSTTGRPHWLVIGEAHRLCPAVDADPLLEPQSGGSSRLYVSVHPEQVCAAALRSVSLVVAMGRDAGAALDVFCQSRGEAPPQRHLPALNDAEALGWLMTERQVPFVFAVAPETPAPARAKPKDRLGDLSPDRSFYFRGPAGRLNLRAQNLPLFLQIGQGVDEETWLHHLHAGDYSRWLRIAYGDEVLAERIAAIEHEGGSAELTRERVEAALESTLQKP